MLEDICWFLGKTTSFFQRGADNKDTMYITAVRAEMREKQRRVSEKKDKRNYGINNIKLSIKQLD